MSRIDTNSLQVSKIDTNRNQHKLMWVSKIKLRNWCKNQYQNEVCKMQNVVELLQVSKIDTNSLQVSKIDTNRNRHKLMWVSKIKLRNRLINFWSTPAACSNSKNQWQSFSSKPSLSKNVQCAKNSAGKNGNFWFSYKFLFRKLAFLGPLEVSLSTEDQTIQALGSSWNFHQSSSSGAPFAIFASACNFTYSANNSCF